MLPGGTGSPSIVKSGATIAISRKPSTATTFPEKGWRQQPAWLSPRGPPGPGPRGESSKIYSRPRTGDVDARPSSAPDRGRKLLEGRQGVIEGVHGALERDHQDAVVRREVQ